MTISEQLREAALKTQSPIYGLSDSCWRAMRQYSSLGEWFQLAGKTQERTFMLLVAEALE